VPVQALNKIQCCNYYKMMLCAGLLIFCPKAMIAACGIGHIQDINRHRRCSVKFPVVSFDNFSMALAQLLRILPILAVLTVAGGEAAAREQERRLGAQNLSPSWSAECYPARSSFDSRSPSCNCHATPKPGTVPIRRFRAEKKERRDSAARRGIRRPTSTPRWCRRLSRIW
jgi:hypothetical protein